MAQRVVSGEQYEEVLIRGNAEGSALPITGALRIPEHDYVGFVYSGSTLTGISYKSGGVSGETVASLVLSYDGNDNLISVAKS